MSTSEARRLWLRTALWVVLGWWIGGWALFAFVVARTAFRVLPSTQVAGQLVGPVLAALHLYGAAAGIALLWGRDLMAWYAQFLR